MTKKLIKATPKDILGSSFAGYLKASYRTIVDSLGEPNDATKEGKWKSGDNKIKAEWAFKIKSKQGIGIVTIYDYKDPRPVETIDLWHIGSKGKVNIEQFLGDRFPKLNARIDLRKNY